MTEVTTGEQQSTDQENEAMTLSEAVRIVKRAIAAEGDRLRQISTDEEADPVLLEGETATGCGAHIMVDPAKVAQIMLNYEYPLYRILDEDAPQRMWNELARLVGLNDVCFVDL